MIRLVDITAITCLLLSAALWQAQICHPFVLPPSNGIAARAVAAGHTGRTTQLANMFILIQEEEDDGDEAKNKPTNKSDDGSKESAPVEIRFILDGLAAGEKGDPKVGSTERIAQWKKELQRMAPAPLTTMRRVRMEKEIALLERLATSNEAAPQLARLWVSERGPETARAVEVAGMLVRQGNPMVWAQAEAILVGIIEKEGVQFVAPLQILATLYAVQGRIQDSKDLNEMVLQQKPWHMGALVGAFNDCKALNDYKGLVTWDGDRMPSLKDPARAGWAHRMADKARLALKNAEEGLQGYFDPDLHYRSFGSEGSIVLEEEHGADAWQ